MAKDFEDKFFEELKEGVVYTNTELEERKSQLLALIADMEASPVKDPRQLEKLKQELAKVDKKISKEMAEKAVETGELVGERAAELDDDQQVAEEEITPASAEVEAEIVNEDEEAKIEQAKMAYHDAMVALHEKKLATIRNQLQNRQLVSTESDYEQELSLEAQLYLARDAYLEFVSEDPYTELRTEFIRQEKEAKEDIETELRNRAKRYREIEEEIRKIDKREAEINEELLAENITETQIEALNNELKELGGKRKKLELELAEVKESLDEAINTRRERLVNRAGLEQQQVETFTSGDKRNYDYQNSKIAEMNNNFDVATKQHYKNIKNRIIERRDKIKKINMELRDIDDTDFERRLVLLNELDKETHMLEADMQAKRELDRGIIPDLAEMQEDAREKAEDEKARQKEFDEATEEVREVIEEKKHRQGEAIVEKPELANEEERDRATSEQAATVAVADQNLVQNPVEKCVIQGLEDKVRDPNDPIDAQAIVEHDESLKEADKKLEDIEQNLTTQ